MRSGQADIWAVARGNVDDDFDWGDFSSNRPNLTEDRNFDDIWIATRDSIFEPRSAPERLGPNVNSAGYQDVAPSLSADGRTMLMSSKRSGGMAAGTFDLYVTSRKRPAR